MPIHTFFYYSPNGDNLDKSKKKCEYDNMPIKMLPTGYQLL
jgi:hypothetical protein